MSRRVHTVEVLAEFIRLWWIYAPLLVTRRELWRNRPAWWIARARVIWCLNEETRNE